MGTFRVNIQVGDLEGSRYEPLEALVDTGASHLVVPRQVLERLDIVVEEHWPFELADNSVREFAVGQVRLRGMAGRASAALSSANLVPPSSSVPRPWSSSTLASTQCGSGSSPCADC